MTEIQQQIHDQITALLSEHFTASVLAVLADDPEDTNGTNGLSHTFWAGGLCNAIGLADAAIDDFRAERRSLMTPV